MNEMLILSTPPENMTAQQRRHELIGILSVGLMRLFTQQSSSLSAPCEDSFLDFDAKRSGVRRHRLRERTGG